jgi:hypothetical protein
MRLQTGPLRMRLQTDSRNLQSRACCCRQNQGNYNDGHEAADRVTGNDAADRPKELTVAIMRLQTDLLGMMLQRDPRNLTVAGMMLQTDPLGMMLQTDPKCLQWRA